MNSSPPPVNAEHAEHTLETIRTLMARSQRYEHISGHSGLVAGAITLAGSVLLATGILPFSAPVNFAVVWTTVFIVAAIAHGWLTFARARQRDEPVWSRQARTVLLAVLPGLGAAVVVTIAVWRQGDWESLPADWLLFYGCGTLATGFFAPQSITRLGLACLLIGGLSRLVSPAWPGLTMAVGFGMTHLVFGGCVLVAERREMRERQFWQEIESIEV